MRPYLHDEICKITHTEITVIIDTSEQGYNEAISSWRDMQNHTHTSILLACRRSCCMWSLNKLHFCWWFRELIPGLQWDRKAFWTCTFVCKSLLRVEGESIGKIMIIGQRMKDCSSWRQWSLDTGWNCSSWCQEVLGYLPRTRLRGRSMSQEFFSQLC
jgi:hypothetical protein